MRPRKAARTREQIQHDQRALEQAVEFDRRDLVAGTVGDFKAALEAAFRLGILDESNDCPMRTGRQVAPMLATNWRTGHMTYLLNAYKSARWHISVMGAPNA